MEPTPGVERCHECGSEFQQKRFWQRWCKPDCRRAHYKRKMQEDRQKLKDIQDHSPAP
jgi:hypothetical protein